MKTVKKPQQQSLFRSEKELIIFVALNISILLAIEFLAAWVLRAMPDDMMKIVLISIPLLVCMVIDVIILSFGRGETK